ncbi:HlyD family efflux transporter periplasmic adaptor subunit, partial [Anaeromyxobacter oryzisoli]|uniref:HlyD family efflux transporter periplasmic adaptor subunit n=1 Tax=Anaeromyxobacter oryzisoli TaxID=2925408 RepID=UPI001F583400
MKKPSRKTSVAVGAVAILAIATFAVLRPRPVPVEVATAVRGPIRATVEGTGRTRVRDLFVVTAPVPGHLERLAVREGDAVRAGEPVATLVPGAPAPLDARTRRELGARRTA